MIDGTGSHNFQSKDVPVKNWERFYNDVYRGLSDTGWRLGKI